MITYLDSKHMFVQTSCEMCIKQEPISHSFTDNSSDKPEIVKMVGIDGTVLIWLESTSILGRCEKRIVRIEHLLCEDPEKFSGQTACIDSFFVGKSYMKSTTEFIRMPETKLAICIIKDVSSTNCQT